MMTVAYFLQITAFRLYMTIYDDNLFASDYQGHTVDMKRTGLTMGSTRFELHVRRPSGSEGPEQVLA